MPVKRRRTIPTDPDAGLYPSEAAELLGTSVSTIRQYRNDGLLPFYMIGSHYRYRRSDVVACQAQLQGTTAVATRRATKASTPRAISGDEFLRRREARWGGAG